MIAIESSPASLPLPSIVVARELAELAAWHAPHVNIAVHRRELAPALERDAWALLRRLGDCPVLTTVGEDAVDELRYALGGAPTLARDIAALAELLIDLTGCDRVGVRLTRLQRAMCPRWHTDYVTARLVTTYVGAGTEYASNHLIDRRLIGLSPPISHTAREALRHPEAAQHAAEGDVVLLKGDAWPGNAGLGALHRSPDASPERPRLVLTLDAQFTG